LPKKSGIL